MENFVTAGWKQATQLTTRRGFKLLRYESFVNRSLKLTSVMNGRITMSLPLKQSWEVRQAN